jgi:glycolate oxidase FAD binding subunit
LNVPDSATILAVRDAADIRDAIAAANGNKTTLAIRAGGSKARIGATTEAETEIELSALRGIIDYDPAELVLTAAAATPLAEIEALVEGHGQMLGFEPMDYGPLFGSNEGSATIGGTIAANCSGPRRFAGGAARDHFLGFEAVSGRGEIFKGGAKVVKNVTGYDLPKLMAGSWGTLAVLTHVTVRIVPRPRQIATLVLAGLSDRKAAAAMASAIGATTAITGAAHIPAALAATLPIAALSAHRSALTLLRVEAYSSSVAPHSKALAAPLATYGTPFMLEDPDTRLLWSYLRDVRLFAADPRPLWRISVAPMAGAAVTEALAPHGAEWFYDWAGGLVWLVAPQMPDAGAELVRAAAAKAQGYAVLIRAPASIRADVPAFTPATGALRDLAERVKTAFDPMRVLNPGRLFAAGTAGSL